VSASDLLSQISAFVVQLVAAVEGKLSGSKAEVFAAILPIVLEFAQSETVFTDSAREALQERVHAALRKAKLLEEVDL
jgi:hypothetical protein